MVTKKRVDVRELRVWQVLCDTVTEFLLVYQIHGVFMFLFHSLFIFGASQVSFPLPGILSPHSVFESVNPLSSRQEIFSQQNSIWIFLSAEKKYSIAHFYKHKNPVLAHWCFNHNPHFTLAQYISNQRLPLAKEKISEATDLLYFVLSLLSSKILGTELGKYLLNYIVNIYLVDSVTNEGGMYYNETHF